MAKVVTDGKKIDISSIIPDLSKEEREELLKVLKKSDKEEDDLIREYKENQAKKLANLISTTRAYEERLKSLKNQLKETPMRSEEYSELLSQIEELEKMSAGAASERDGFIKTLEDANQQQIIAQAKEIDVTNRMKSSIIDSKNKLEEADIAFNEASKNLEEISKDLANTDPNDVSQQQLDSYNKAKEKFNKAKRDKAAAEKAYAAAGNTSNYEDVDTDKVASKVSSSMPSILQDIAKGLFSKEHTSISGKMAESIGSSLDNSKVGKSLPVSLSKITNIAGKILDVAMATRKTINGWVDSAADVLANNVGRINAALEGTGKTYKNSIESAVEGLGLNRFVKQTEYLSQIANLTTRGIAFNVEQRALLETIKDKTISSFSSVEGNLLRLVRLKQQDVTAQQYGLEIALRNTLNKVFKDSTYLQDLYDSISSAITDAVVISGKGDIIEYGSVAQTWMGAMYESGIDSSTVNKFANAINYLGSGNVQGLASDSEMQRLVLLSMDTIGMDYADILQQGLSSSDITDLMKAIVDYLVQISNNTKNNNVLTSSYTQLFGMSMADLQGFKNLQGKMNSLAYVNSSNVASVVEHELALYQSDERVLVNEQIENIFDNAKFAFGSEIAGDASSYLSWKMSNLVVDIVEQVVGHGFMGANIIGKAATKAIGGIGVGAELVLFANIFKGLLSTLEEFPAIFESGKNGRLQDLITVSGSPSSGGSSVSTSASLTTTDSNFKSVTTYSDIKSGERYQTKYQEYSADESGWEEAEPEEDKVLTELKKVTSALVVANADESHRALATFLVGMTDDTLRSFASIFADEDAMQETFQGKNNVLKDNLFNFADDTTSNSSKESSSKESKSESTPSSGNIKTT